MCKFFSFISDGNANFYYFNDEQRKKILKEELVSNGFTVTNPDSHSTIARFYFKNGAEDSMNKYEFNPLTNLFEIDQINTKDDSVQAKDFVMSLDFRSIVSELIIKKIENPLDQEFVYIDSYHIALLQKWASVWDSVGASVGASVWDSVWDSVGAYQSSFFDLKNNQWKYCEKIDFEGNDNPFQSCIDLWSLGLVPSFGGQRWRLHAGKNAKIVFEITKEDLQKWEITK